jgi:hypothetical protein
MDPCTLQQYNITNTKLPDNQFRHGQNLSTNMVIATSTQQSIIKLQIEDTYATHSTVHLDRKPPKHTATESCNQTPAVDRSGPLPWSNRPRNRQDETRKQRGLGDCLGAGEDGEEPAHQVPLHRRLLRRCRAVWALYGDKIGGGRQPAGHHLRYPDTLAKRRVGIAITPQFNFDTLIWDLGKFRWRWPGAWESAMGKLETGRSWRRGAVEDLPRRHLRRRRRHAPRGKEERACGRAEDRWEATLRGVHTTTNEPYEPSTH